MESTAIPDEHSVVHLNIGGQRFTTLISTIQNGGKYFDNSRLKNLHSALFIVETNEYFFDRDPRVFESVLNYCRTGELHIAHNLCGLGVETELRFWGIDESKIENCCWMAYTSDKEQKATLDDFISKEKCPLVRQDKSEDTGRLKKFQDDVWDILNEPLSSTFAKVVAAISIVMTLVSIINYCLQTMPYFQQPLSDSELAEYYSVDLADIQAKITISKECGNYTSDNYNCTTGNITTIYPQTSGMISMSIWFMYVDFICMVFFTIEIVLRMLFVPRKLKFLLNIYTWVDILSLVPFYVMFISELIDSTHKFLINVMDLMHALRMIRLLQTFRIFRYSAGVRAIIFTIRASIAELCLLNVIIGVAVLFFGSFVYFVDDNTVFTSIPQSLWWAIITLTTVGYGDMTPKTPWGYVIGTLCAMSGVMTFAMTLPILVNNFMLYYSFATSTGKKCV